MNGYRKMISDRIPPIWDMTIRWCKCRNRFIEHVYDRVVRLYRNDVMHTRKERAKLISKELKEDLNPTITDFREVVRLKYLFAYGNIIDYQYWKSVADWNQFFATHVQYIKNTCLIAKKTKGTKHDELVKEISERYNIDLKLADYILTYLKL